MLPLVLSYRGNRVSQSTLNRSGWVTNVIIAKTVAKFLTGGENPHAVTFVPPRKLHSIFFLIVLLCPAIRPQAQETALTYPRNLAELSAQSATIVHGHVVSARVEPHPQLRNLNTVVVTMRVQEVLKGQSGSTFTFRQFIWSLRDRYDGGGYRKGQELLLLMNQPSRYGLSSPAGMEQGSFLIRRDPAGKLIAINGHSNAGLFRNMAGLAARKNLQLSPAATAMIGQHRQGAVPLQIMEEVIRQFAGSK